MQDNLCLSRAACLVQSASVLWKMNTHLQGWACQGRVRGGCRPQPCRQASGGGRQVRCQVAQPERAAQDCHGSFQRRSPGDSSRWQCKLLTNAVVMPGWLLCTLSTAQSQLAHKSPQPPQEGTHTPTASTTRHCSETTGDPCAMHVPMSGNQHLHHCAVAFAAPLSLP